MTIYNDSFSTYGGQKQNRQAPVNQTFDYDALQLNVALSKVAGMTHVIWRAWFLLSWTNNPTAPTLTAWDATWKVATPGGIVLTSLGVGQKQIALPASVTDENGVSETLSLSIADARCQSITTLVPAQAIASANLVQVATFNTSGSLTDPTPGTSILVLVR